MTESSDKQRCGVAFVVADGDESRPSITTLRCNRPKGHDGLHSNAVIEGNGLKLHTADDQEQLRPDGGLDLSTLSRGRLEVAFAVPHLTERSSTPPTATDVEDYLADSGRPTSESNVSKSLQALHDDGILERRRPDEGGDPGRKPHRYWLTEEGGAALRSLVEQRVEQLGLDDPSWVAVLEQEDNGSDRVVEEAFCPGGCGKVHAGPGLCEDCLEERESQEDIIADGGGHPCAICGVGHEDRGDALRCCSGVLEGGPR